MDPITRHHLQNLANQQTVSVEREDGGVDVRSVFTVIEGVGQDEEGNEIHMLFPTIWDGIKLSNEKAKEKAIDSGIKWPTDTDPDKLHLLDQQIHEGFNSFVPIFEDGKFNEEDVARRAKEILKLLEDAPEKPLGSDTSMSNSFF